MNATTINLESLLDLSAKLVESNDREHILNAALLSLMGKLRVTKACALVPHEGGLRRLISKGKVDTEMFTSFEDATIFDCEAKHDELFNEGFVLCAPVYSKGTLRGAIALGKSIGSQGYSETERHYASLVSIIAANALQTADNMKFLLEEKSRVESRNQLLESLFEMSNDLGSLFTRDQILQIFSFRLMGQVMVSRFALIVYHDDGGCAIEFNRLQIDLPSTLLSELRSISTPTRMRDWNGSEENGSLLRSVKTELLIPLMIKNEARGVLLVAKKVIGEFREYDMRFIEALGTTLATALENARLFQEEVEKKRIESEMNVARQIQHRLFPEFLPQIPGVQLAARNISSYQVGGDYYDAIRVNDHQVLLAIADVSGKGMPASILMANVQAALRVLAPLVPDVRDVVARLNDVLYENTGHDKFVTFFGSKLSTEDMKLEYCNAGHNPPVLFRADASTHELSSGGLILGVMPTFKPYELGQIHLLPGDVVLFFTDGVNEAMDRDLREYGDARIRECISKHRHESAESILDALLQDVQAHVSSAPQSDDITVMILKVD